MTHDRVREAIHTRRELVNEAFPEELPITPPERLYKASRHLIDAGGKRLRPTITLVAAEALADVEPLSVDYREFPTIEATSHGKPRSSHQLVRPKTPPTSVDVLVAAISVEVIQSFTLIHDDIMDDDPLRRGVPAVHEEFDLETAILAGDTLYSRSFELMLETGADVTRTVEALRLLASTCRLICEGQAFDVEFEERTDVTTDEYLEMVEMKTAVLYAAAACLPAILLGGDEETVDALYGYGLDIGRAFQIQDDVLDLTVPTEKLGKQRGSDLIEGKRTMLTVHATQQGVDVDGLVSASDVDAVTETEIDEAVAVLEEAGSIEYARTLASDLVEQGKDRLSILPENESRAVLEDLADFLIERGY